MISWRFWWYFTCPWYVKTDASANNPDSMEFSLIAAADYYHIVRSATYQVSAELNRYCLVNNKNCFDALRFFAATPVLYSHCFPLLGVYEREPVGRWSGYMMGGEIGVAIFFAISGYLMTASLMTSEGPFGFFIKRTLRIFPALIVVVILTTPALQLKNRFTMIGIAHPGAL